MKPAIDVWLHRILAIAAIAALSAGTWAGIEGAKTARSSRDDLKAIAKATSDLEGSTYATEGSVANLADTMNGIASGLSDHETAELAAAQGMTTKADALLDTMTMKVGTLLDHTDVDVRGLGDTEQAATLAIKSLGDDSHGALGSAKNVLDDAAIDLSNPAIAESIADIRDSAANTSKGTAEGLAILVDGHKVADHYTAQILKPVSKAKRALLAVSAAAGSFLHSVLF
jgi:hypothetical protein